MAEYGGKRQTRLAPSTLLVQSRCAKAMAKVIAEWWDNEPEMDRVRFFGADHNHFCECEACRLCPDVSTLAEVL